MGYAPGMTCTRCFEPTWVEFDPGDLAPELVSLICENWMCNDCLDEVEREEMDVKLEEGLAARRYTDYNDVSAYREGFRDGMKGYDRRETHPSSINAYSAGYWDGSKEKES